MFHHHHRRFQRRSLHSRRHRAVQQRSRFQPLRRIHEAFDERVQPRVARARRREVLQRHPSIARFGVIDRDPRFDRRFLVRPSRLRDDGGILHHPERERAHVRVRRRGVERGIGVHRGVDGDVARERVRASTHGSSATRGARGRRGVARATIAIRRVDLDGRSGDPRRRSQIRVVLLYLSSGC